MKIRTFSALCAFSSFLFISCVANTGTTEPQNTEQSPAEQPAAGIPENPGIPQQPQEPGIPQNPGGDPNDKFVSLDGVDDFLTHAGNLVGGENSYTIEFFIKFDQVALTAAGQALYSFTDASGLVSGMVQRVSSLGDHSLLGTMNGGGIGSTVDLAPNQWYHVAVSFENNTGFRQKVHINGVRVTNGGGSQGYLSASERFELGRPISLMWGPSAYLKASVDGLRISRGVRYAGSTAVVPDRKNMTADTSTIAVWNFSETAIDGKYYDSVSQKILVKMDISIAQP